MHKLIGDNRVIVMAFLVIVCVNSYLMSLGYYRQ